MRLFVGLDLPNTTLHILEALVAELSPLAPIQWSPASNLHITTKFIGEWPEERLEDLKHALAAVRRPGPIQIQVEGLGWFPNPHSPRVFWAGVHAPDTLTELARETDAAAVALGLPEEPREFRPHLTLARVRQAVNLLPLKQAVAKLESVDFGNFTAQSQFLYWSKAAPGGSVYTKLAEFPLS